MVELEILSVLWYVDVDTKGSRGEFQKGDAAFPVIVSDRQKVNQKRKSM